MQFYTKNYLSLDTVITPDEGTLKPYTVEQYFGNNINVTLKNGR
uniref:Dipeptidyl peptidase IV (DPP IV) low complexity region n=1 Tax=Siphoviridae sp. ctxMM9 TaxID=2827973 RepID=A0A8S5T6E1_9CAUD|nr:MAG TPA: Dipeptidyl peptidase IV (DPP IV) low complexity region [Siphoviridae sp. ctxMM9]